MDKQIIDEERMFECVWCKYGFKESDANFILSENPNECVCSGCITEWADNLLCDLIRKEQECEELKEEALHSDYGIMKNNLEGAITYLEKENKDLSKIIDCKNGTVLSLKQQLDQLKAEVKSKTEYIQEQRDIINQYSKEIEMYKKCQGKRASKREEELKAENDELKRQYKELQQLQKEKTEAIKEYYKRQNEKISNMTERQLLEEIYRELETKGADNDR